MDGENTQNGHKPDKVYVRFGPLPTQEMPLEWAESMLMEWRSAHPLQFGKALATAADQGGAR